MINRSTYDGLKKLKQQYKEILESKIKKEGWQKPLVLGSQIEEDTSLIYLPSNNKLYLLDDSSKTPCPPELEQPETDKNGELFLSNLSSLSALIKYKKFGILLQILDLLKDTKNIIGFNGNYFLNPVIKEMIEVKEKIEHKINYENGDDINKMRKM